MHPRAPSHPERIWIQRYLSIRGLFLKSLALICALGSGLSIGIEGLVIHILDIVDDPIAL